MSIILIFRENNNFLYKILSTIWTGVIDQACVGDPGTANRRYSRDVEATSINKSTWPMFFCTIRKNSSYHTLYCRTD